MRRMMVIVTENGSGWLLLRRSVWGINFCPPAINRRRTPLGRQIFIYVSLSLPVVRVSFPLTTTQGPLVISHQLTWRINGSKLIEGDVVERGWRCCRIINRPICCTNRLLLYGRCDIQFPVTQHNTLALWRRDKESNLIFIVLLKQCRSIHGKRSHYYYYFIMEGKEEWVRACNQESG